MIKPRKLQPGSRVAAVSLSWGGAAAFPHRYRAGKRQFEETFAVTVVETEHALREPDWLYKNPRARAEDWMRACADPAIDGIVSIIGGEDSIRILPYLDLDIIREHPKAFLGYSDTTVSHLACFKADLVSFYGPSFMSGFAENGGIFPYLADSVRASLFEDAPIGRIEPNRGGWTVEYLDWSDPDNQQRERKLRSCTGWRFHQREGVAEGILFGGCLEVLDWLRGTEVWPASECLEGAILFLETSEEAPPPARLTRFLRSLAAMGVLHRLSGILLGRPGGQIDPETFGQYDEALCKTLREECGLGEIALVTHMDFGHTDPMLVLPLGVRARIDSARQQISIEEPAVIP